MSQTAAPEKVTFDASHLTTPIERLNVTTHVVIINFRALCCSLTGKTRQEIEFALAGFAPKDDCSQKKSIGELLVSIPSSDPMLPVTFKQLIWN